MSKNSLHDRGDAANDQMGPVLDLAPAFGRINKELAEQRQVLDRVAEALAAPIGLLDRDQGAKFLKCSIAQLGALVKSGDVPVVRFDGRPRFRVEDLQAFAARHLSDEGGGP